MPQDAFTLRYLCEELNGILVNGRINRIVQPTADTTVLTVYTSCGVKKLVLDVNPSCPRIGLTETEPQSETPATGFCLLLKKHLISAVVNKISLVGFDRIVKIDLQPSVEFFDSPEKTLYVELMGRYSNVILTENGKVLGGNRGINFLDNNVRPLISGLPYKLPPVGDKVEPKNLAIKTFFSCIESVTAENICAKIQGIAQTTAQEIANGFHAAACNGVGDAFYGYLNDFVYNSPVLPCVILQNGKPQDFCVFPYKTLDGQKVQCGTLLQAENAYFTAKAEINAFKNLKERLNGIISSALKKSKKRLFAVNARIKEAENAEENRVKGELILANIYRLKGGESEAEFDNYYDGTKTTVSLNENLSPSKNAENYYKKYNKQKRALTLLAPQRESAEAEMNYLTGVASEISLAEDVFDLKAVEDELIAAGFIKKTTSKKGVYKPLENPRVYDVYGFNVKVGRNNAENDKITFSAKPWDIWLHAKDYHSSHVIIETCGKNPSEKVIIAAAEICAYYSKGREGGKTEIVYCERKFVKKPKKSALGFCIYSEFKSVVVNPEPHKELLKPN